MVAKFSVAERESMDSPKSTEIEVKLDACFNEGFAMCREKAQVYLGDLDWDGFLKSLHCLCSKLFGYFCVCGVVDNLNSVIFYSSIRGELLYATF